MIALFIFLFAKVQRPQPANFYVYVNKSDVKVYKGPANSYPLYFIVNHKGYPLHVIGQFEVWYEVCDYEGTKGWVHKSSVSQSGRNGLILKNTSLYQKPTEKSAVAAQIDRGCIVKILQYTPEWCQIKVNHQYQDATGKVKLKTYKVWLKRESLWGLDPSE